MKPRGFTLFEILVAVAIAGLLMAAIMSVFFALGRARMRQQSIAEVEEQGYAALELMEQTVRNAEYVTSPGSGVSSTSMSVTTFLASTTPTTFALAGSSIQMTEGTTSAPVLLTSPQVLVTGLSFTTLTATNTDGSIKIQFTLSHATTSRYETNYSATFYGSATVRYTQ